MIIYSEDEREMHPNNMVCCGGGICIRMAKIFNLRCSGILQTELRVGFSMPNL